MYKEDMALNNLQDWYAIKQNQTKLVYLKSIWDFSILAVIQTSEENH